MMGTEVDEMVKISKHIFFIKCDLTSRFGLFKYYLAFFAKYVHVEAVAK